MPKGPSGKLSCPGALTWAWTWTGPADRCVLHTEQRSHLEMERWSSGAATSDGQECITLNTQLRKPESFREELGGQDVDLVHSRTNEVIPGAAAGDLWDRLQI
uniref:Uncharacterized protein n=1 Tax=Molossus molossus TaxID=27622 RepID=A0A7J8E3B8_MOLMO|nr:hypothetical protein HJG59_009071 [Molossus molossus]